MTGSCCNNSKPDLLYIGTRSYNFLKCSRKTCEFFLLLLHLVLSSFRIILSIDLSGLFSPIFSTLTVSQHCLVPFLEEVLSFSLLHFLPFLSKFGQKYENCLLKIRFGVQIQIDSSMLDSMITFNFSVLNQKNILIGGGLEFEPKVKFVCLRFILF